MRNKPTINLKARVYEYDGKLMQFQLFVRFSSHFKVFEEGKEIDDLLQHDQF